MFDGLGLIRFLHNVHIASCHLGFSLIDSSFFVNKYTLMVKVSLIMVMVSVIYEGVYYTSELVTMCVIRYSLTVVGVPDNTRCRVLLFCSIMSCVASANIILQ